MTDKKIKVTLVKSPIGYSQRQRKVVDALGLRKMGRTVELSDTPTIRGMLNKVSHLLKIDEVDA